MHRILAGIVLAFVLAATASSAQEWPNGPVQLIVPSKPGGGTDVMARIFSDYLQAETKAPVVVVNQPAGGGTVAFEQVRNAAPDGQTLLFMHTGLIVNAHTGRYDHGASDFTVIGLAQSYPPQVFAVGPKAPWNSIRDFVEDARARPGALTAGVSLGGTSHFILGALMMAENIDLKLVEASAEVDKVAAIQGGHIDIGNLGAGQAKQYVEAGDMKVLSMVDPTPSPKYPDFVPAVEQGVNVSWIAPLVLWGPAGMETSLVSKINAAMKNMATDSTTQERLGNADSAFTYYTAEEAHAIVAAEDAKIGALAKRLGLSQ